MTLTEVSYYSRRFLPIGIIFFLVFLIFFYAVQAFLLYQEATKPKVVSVQDIFGIIKKPVLQNPVKGTFSYSLDTIEGQPVTATDSAKVFFLPSATTKFGFREKIYVMAKNLGFDSTAIKHTLKNTEASFKDDKQTLSIDITNFNFTYEYDVKNEPTIFANSHIPGARIVEERASEYLRAVGRYPEELSKGKRNIAYYIYDPATSRLTPTQRPQEANVVEVNFYRPDVEAVPQPLSTVSPNYFTSQNYVIMVFNEEGFKVIKSQVRFFEKSEEQVGVYPLKTGDEAYEQLKAGQGTIAVSSKKGGQVTIKKMFLAYFDPDTYQEYLQPVYVFLGEGDFVGYVPAVKKGYIED